MADFVSTIKLAEQVPALKAALRESLDQWQSWLGYVDQVTGRRAPGELARICELRKLLR